MSDPAPSRLDAFLDLLAEEIAQRIEARRAAVLAEPGPARSESVPSDELPATEIASLGEKSGPIEDLANQADASTEDEGAEQPAEPALAARDDVPAAASELHIARIVGRLMWGVLAAALLINIPFGGDGTALARSVPNSASLVLRDGLLVKETDSAEVWVYRGDAFHWVTDLDAFLAYGYRWDDVHVVENGFLSRVQKGAPLGRLFKCDQSPHIYVSESGRKRWIVDIPTFEAEGYLWRDVQIVPCAVLRSRPDGESIPAGRGTPPPPLP